MTYRNQPYSLVNEIEDGIDLIQCWRCDTEPQKTIITKNGKWVKSPTNLQSEWEEIK